MSIACVAHEPSESPVKTKEQELQQLKSQHEI